MKKILFISLAVLLISCGTLPKPTSQNATLLVIKATTKNTSDLDYYLVGYKFYFSGIEEPVWITPRNGYYLIDTLPVGTNALVKVVQFNRKDINVLGKPDNYSYAFNLVAGNITIFPYSFEVSQYPWEEREGWTWQNYKFNRLSEDDISRIMLHLAKYRNVEYWKKSNITEN